MLEFNAGHDLVLNTECGVFQSSGTRLGKSDADTSRQAFSAGWAFELDFELDRIRRNSDSPILNLQLGPAHADFAP